MDQLAEKVKDLAGVVEQIRNDVKTTMEYAKTAAKNELHSKKKERDIKALDIP